MAKLIAVCRDDTDFQFERRQIPLIIEDTLTMVMEIPETNISTHYVCENELQPFVKGYHCLSKDELAVALMVRQKEVFALLAHAVPCVGCRRSVERLYSQLVESQQPALEPLIITNTGILTISKNFLQDPKFIYALFYIHGSRLNEMVDNIPKSRRNRRCPLHSLETHKSRPSGSWIDVWDLLSQECRDEVVLIDSDALLDTLESYLRKHRFCSECKSKVIRAYNILAGELDGPSEKGYCAALYDGLKSCPQERHIHVLCDTDFIAHLIGRAEPELAGGRRERHAKTLDIAQEEVLTCLGIHLWERLHRLWQKLRAEEQTWQMLFFLGVDALRKHFEVSVENKNGISRLEQVVEEISEAERVKEMKREQKRLKKKARRREKCKKCKSNGEMVIGEEKPSEPKQNGSVNGHGIPDEFVGNGQEDSCDEEDDRDSVDTPCSCEDLQCGQRTKRAASHRSVGDCGYVSENKVWSGRETQNGVMGTWCQRNDVDGVRSERWENDCLRCLCPQDAELSSQESGKAKMGKSGNTKGKKEPPVKGTKVVPKEGGVRTIDDEEKRLLQSMGWTSDSGSCKDCGSSDDEDVIPEQEIERFKANQKLVSIQRRELREKLREKFQNMASKDVPTAKGSHPLDNRQINGVTYGVVH